MAEITPRTAAKAGYALATEIGAEKRRRLVAEESMRMRQVLAQEGLAAVREKRLASEAKARQEQREFDRRMAVFGEARRLQGQQAQQQYREEALSLQRGTQERMLRQEQRRFETEEARQRRYEKQDREKHLRSMYPDDNDFAMALIYDDIADGDITEEDAKPLLKSYQKKKYEEKLGRLRKATREQQTIDVSARKAEIAERDVALREEAAERSEEAARRDERALQIREKEELRESYVRQAKKALADIFPVTTQVDAKIQESMANAILVEAQQMPDPTDEIAGVPDHLQERGAFFQTNPALAIRRAAAAMAVRLEAARVQKMEEKGKKKGKGKLTPEDIRREVTGEGATPEEAPVPAPSPTPTPAPNTPRGRAIEALKARGAPVTEKNIKYIMRQMQGK